jgi:hypothetical protein
MNEDQFRKRIKQIFAGIKRGEHDSSPAEIHYAFHANVLGRSGGAWDEAIALQEVQQIEQMFGVQPEAVTEAVLVKEADVIAALMQFLKEREYTYTPIQVSSTKTPDGCIDGSGKKYLCEVKSPELKFDHSAAPFGYKFATSHRKILDFIHTAIKQFKSQDTKHELPHILIYTSAHPLLHWKSFLDAIQGGVVDQKGNRSPDLSNTHVYKSTLPLITDIDLYIWFQVGTTNKNFNQVSYFINETSEHRGECIELVGNLSRTKVSSMNMDNIISLTSN